MPGQGLILPPPRVTGDNIRQREDRGLLPSSRCRAVSEDGYSDFRRLIPSNFSMYFS
jgi:hypothetical protein